MSAPFRIFHYQFNTRVTPSIYLHYLFTQPDSFAANVGYQIEDDFLGEGYMSFRIPYLHTFVALGALQCALLCGRPEVVSATSVVSLSGQNDPSVRLFEAEEFNQSIVNSSLQFGGDLAGSNPLFGAVLQLIDIRTTVTQAAGTAFQDNTQGGSFFLRSAANEVLLSGTFGAGALTQSALGNEFWLSFNSESIELSGGSLASEFVEDTRLSITSDGITQTSYQTLEEQVLTGYEQVKVGERLVCRSAEGCRHTKPPSISKRYFLSSYIRLKPYELEPIFETRAIYSTVIREIPIGTSFTLTNVHGEISGGRSPVSEVPEPSSIALLAAGMLGLRRRQTRQH